MASHRVSGAAIFFVLCIMGSLWTCVGTPLLFYELWEVLSTYTFMACMLLQAEVVHPLLQSLKCIHQLGGF